MTAVPLSFTILLLTAGVEKGDGNFISEVEDLWMLSLSRSGVCICLNVQRVCLIKDVEVVDRTKYSSSSKIIFELMVGNDIIYTVGAVMYVILSKAKKTGS